MNQATVYNIIAVIVIPFIIGFLKKVNLPAKWAPISAFLIACLIVGIGKLIGIELDIKSIADLIINGLVISGVSVLGYDTVKKLTEPVA